MTTSNHTRCTTLRRALLVCLTLSPLLIVPGAFAAERDGTVLFFSAEDLTEILSHASLPDLSQAPPSLAWQDQQDAEEHEGPLERSYRWGDGLGIDGYAHPGGRRPLWGY